MTRLKWFASFVFVAALLGGALLLFKREGEAPAPLEASGLAASAPVTGQAKKAAEEFRAAPRERRLEEFYQAESRRIGAIDPNPDATQARLEAVAGELTQDELIWLKGRALNSRTEGDARFFAAYLLALAPPETSLGALREIALSPVPKHKNPGLVELERQIRAQAVEGISRNRKSSAARDALLDIVDKQEDEFLRDRAHRGLYAWQTGKAVAEQDKEGLGKILYKK